MYPEYQTYSTSNVPEQTDERLSAIKQFDSVLARLVDNVTALETQLAPITRQSGPEPASERPGGPTEIERLIDQLDVQATRVAKLAERVVV